MLTRICAKCGGVIEHFLAVPFCYRCLTVLNQIKNGDYVTRMLAGTAPMELKVTEVTEDLIVCEGGWKFDRKTGAEIDEDLDWGPPPQHTGSFLLPTPTTYRYN